MIRLGWSTATSFTGSFSSASIFHLSLTKGGSGEREREREREWREKEPGKELGSMAADSEDHFR